MVRSFLFWLELKGHLLKSMKHFLHNQTFSLKRFVLSFFSFQKCRPFKCEREWKMDKMPMSMNESGVSELNRPGHLVLWSIHPLLTIGRSWQGLFSEKDTSLFYSSFLTHWTTMNIDINFTFSSTAPRLFCTYSWWQEEILLLLL